MGTPRKPSPVFICAVLVSVFWAARYLHIGGFGLYEDDLALIPNAFQMTQGELFRWIGTYIANLYGHARPLSNSLIYLLSNWGWHLAGLSGAYWLGFALQSLNLCLFYALVHRIASPGTALLSGLAYALFSADTSQAYLTHSLGLHPSLTLWLLAAHAYLRDRRVLAYVLAGVILFAYESPFLVFLGVPLLKKKWDRSLLKEGMLHALVLGLMLAAVFLLRRTIGDGRVSDLSTRELLLTPLLHMLQGPPVSLGSYLLRPIQALQALSTGGSLAVEVGLAAAAGGILVFWLVYRFIDTSSLRLERAAFLSFWSLPAAEPLRLALAGAVLLVYAYPLTYTVRAYAISGRDTRVHAAAVVGAALLVGVLLHGLLRLASRRSQAFRAAAILAVALLLGLLLGYGLVVQSDYTLAWELQQRFWTELTPLIADVEPGTIILIEPSGLQDTRQIGANTWNLPVVIEKSYRFPDGWGTSPRAYRLQPGWEGRIVLDPETFWLNAATVDAPATYYQQCGTTQVIFITTTGGRLQRHPGPLVIDGQAYPLKEAGPAELPRIPEGFLYDFLILNP